MDDPVATSLRESDLLRELAELARGERDEPPIREHGTDAAAAEPSPAPSEVA